MHLAWALVDQSEGVLRPILQKLGANHNRLLKEIDAALGKMSQVQGGAMQSYMGPELKKYLISLLPKPKRCTTIMSAPSIFFWPFWL